MFISRRKNAVYQPISEFETISEQFASEMNANKKSKQDLLIKEIIDIRTRCFLLSLCLDVLNVDKNEEVIDILKSQGIEVDTTNDESFYKSILKIERYIKGFNNKINLKNEEILRYIKDNQAEKPTNYLKNIVIFEEILKIAIDPYKITLAQFAAYSNKIKENNGRRDS